MPNMTPSADSNTAAAPDSIAEGNRSSSDFGLPPTFWDPCRVSATQRWLSHPGERGSTKALTPGIVLRLIMIGNDRDGRFPRHRSYHLADQFVGALEDREGLTGERRVVVLRRRFRVS
jgi:hypothetical protein